MGAACCVATRDRTIQHGSSGEIVHRNFRQSPSWSFRWDNRVVSAGEESASRRNLPDQKSATHVSDVGSSLRRSPVSQERSKNSRSCADGHSIARNTSKKVKQSTESPQVSDPSSLKLSPSVHSSSPSSMSPLSAQSHPLVLLASDNHSSFMNSPSTSSIVDNGRNPDEFPTASNSSIRVSSGNPFSHVTMSSSQRERLSFDNDSCTFSSVQKSESVSMDFQVCEICSKLLTEKKSGWNVQKIIAHNELSVMAVLVCGHVYHAECLEAVTAKCNKYDPACPTCTDGEKLTRKMSGKSRNQFDLGRSSSIRVESKSPKLSGSSSLRISGAKPFLKRHFSLRSRGDKFSSDSQSVRKKGLFSTKSSRE